MSTEHDYHIDSKRIRALTAELIAQRKRMGKTQEALADEAGVYQTTISAIERAISLNMGWWQFYRIMRAYGISIEQAATALGLLPAQDSADVSRDNARITALVTGIEQLDATQREQALAMFETYLAGVRAQNKLTEKR